MTGFGVAVCIIVVLVGVGMYFTGYSMGMQWVLSNTVIEMVDDEEEVKQSDAVDLR